MSIAQKKGDPAIVRQDEHPRDTSLEALARLKGVVRPDGTVTAGNASGVNDGACALLLADEPAAARHGLTPRARVVAMATAGVPPRIVYAITSHSRDDDGDEKKSREKRVRFRVEGDRVKRRYGTSRRAAGSISKGPGQFLSLATGSLMAPQ